MPRADMDKEPDEVSGMFDGVAKRYDLANTVLSGGNAVLWRAATVRAIDPQPGERILDVCSGTGTSTAALAKRGSTVIGVDFSPEMVAAARKRHKNIEFVEADAAKLPFGDDEFDVATVSFGLRNVQDPKAVLSELYRVLKPGGRLVICEFSKPPVAIFRAGYRAYLKWFMPVLGGVVGSNADAYRYLAESIEDWPDQGELSQWIRAAGFIRVAYRNLTSGVVALHRGRKPSDSTVLASVARRKSHTKPIDIVRGKP